MSELQEQIQTLAVVHPVVKALDLLLNLVSPVIPVVKAFDLNLFQCFSVFSAAYVFFVFYQIYIFLRVLGVLRGSGFFDLLFDSDNGIMCALFLSRL